MRIFITKNLGMHYEGVVIGRKTDDSKFEERVLIDPFAGCALGIPDDYSLEEDQKVQNSVVGTILTIKDDTFKTNGVYLPNEDDLI